jgi:hypothetical protein
MRRGLVVAVGVVLALGGILTPPAVRADHPAVALQLVLDGFR